MSYYPNATHILQSWDAGFFGPIKSAWADEVQSWKSKNPNEDFNFLNFPPLLEKVHEKSVKNKQL